LKGNTFATNEYDNPAAIMKGLLCLLLFIWVQKAAAQEAGQSLSRIDSIARSIDSAKGHKLDFAEGTFRYKGKRKPEGNMYVTYIRDSATNALLQVSEDQSMQVTDRTIYYFHQNRLVLVRTVTYPIGSTPATPQAEGVYYFNGSALLHKEERNLTRQPGAYLRLSQGYLKEAAKLK
jgi:hypothetical protein